MNVFDDSFEMEKDICYSAGQLILQKEIEVTNVQDFISIIVPKIEQEFKESFSLTVIQENYQGLIFDFTTERLLLYHKERRLP
ncbi:hypothetical protein IHV12_20070 [Fictibacillus sp. 7GRE50]|jgi:hypothetical protein|uniref:hypothetical protein n=1 Tax=Bacillales TaxID=1385 RepID=UPI0013D0A652|nr:MULTISPECIES: hypothetical protein [Bacillaceae]MBH0167225.1 hypothetical protein [Fictibacillus sp. 7GRE50]